MSLAGKCLPLCSSPGRVSLNHGHPFLRVICVDRVLAFRVVFILQRVVAVVCVRHCSVLRVRRRRQPPCIVIDERSPGLRRASSRQRDLETRIIQSKRPEDRQRSRRRIVRIRLQHAFVRFPSTSLRERFPVPRRICHQKSGSPRRHNALCSHHRAALHSASAQCRHSCIPSTPASLLARKAATPAVLFPNV